MPARDRRPIRRDLPPPGPRQPGVRPTGERLEGRQWEPVPADKARTPPRPDRLPTRAPSAVSQPLGSSTVLTRALLPLRIFFGATFLYAGIDKLIDPAFLKASGAGSIGEQLTAFERVSPIAGLVHLVDPYAVPVGLLIALLEIAIGLGTLLGLLFRWAALAGACLSMLFFLTASWGTHPYYYGPDLPYALGWLTLALAGHGHVYALEDWLAEREAAPPDGWPGRESFGSARRRSATPPMFTDTERRAFLQLGILAIASLAVGGLTGLWGLRQRAEAGDGFVPSGPAGSPDPSPAASAGASPSAAGASPSAAGASSAASPGASASTSPNLVGTLADLRSQGALSFQ
ncbi:MAG TPA: TQO small subunit DoxD, partial [Candidatus Dormibacteraeota bacterium]|nr:TQO small subunit DoxD [Candidatus Dormibacteraeota bacterium]